MDEWDWNTFFYESSCSLSDHFHGNELDEVSVEPLTCQLDLSRSSDSLTLELSEKSLAEKETKAKRLSWSRQNSAAYCSWLKSVVEALMTSPFLKYVLVAALVDSYANNVIPDWRW